MHFIKNILPQSTDLFNGQMKYDLKNDIIDLKFTLRNQLHSYHDHVSLFDDIFKHIG